MNPDREAVKLELNEGWKRLLLVLADMDEEDGRADRAAGLRWLAKNERRPHLGRGGYEWWLMHGEQYDSTPHEEAEDIPHARPVNTWSDFVPEEYDAYLQGAEIVGRWLREKKS